MISFNAFSSEIFINIFYRNNMDISINSNGVCLYSGEILSCINKLKDDIEELNYCIKGLEEPFRKGAKNKKIIIQVSVHQDFNKQNKQNTIKADIENIRQHLNVIKNISLCEITVYTPTFFIS